MPGSGDCIEEAKGTPITGRTPWNMDIGIGIATGKLGITPTTPCGIISTGCGTLPLRRGFSPRPRFCRRASRAPSSRSFAERVSSGIPAGRSFAAGTGAGPRPWRACSCSSIIRSFISMRSVIIRSLSRSFITRSLITRSLITRSLITRSLITWSLITRSLITRSRAPRRLSSSAPAAPRTLSNSSLSIGPCIPIASYTYMPRRPSPGGIPPRRLGYTGMSDGYAIGWPVREMTRIPAGGLDPRRGSPKGLCSGRCA